MDHKVDSRRIDKRSSKKDRTDGPYSAKHVRYQNKIMELSSERSSIPKAEKSVSSIEKSISSIEKKKNKK